MSFKIGSQRGYKTVTKYGKKNIEKIINNSKETRATNDAFELFYKLVQKNQYLIDNSIKVNKDENYGQLFEVEQVFVKMPAIMLENEEFMFKFIPHPNDGVVLTRFWVKSSVNEKIIIMFFITMMTLLCDICKKHNIKFLNDDDESYSALMRIYSSGNNILN